MPGDTPFYLSDLTQLDQDDDFGSVLCALVDELLTLDIQTEGHYALHDIAATFTTLAGSATFAPTRRGRQTDRVTAQDLRELVESNGQHPIPSCPSLACSILDARPTVDGYYPLE